MRICIQILSSTQHLQRWSHASRMKTPICHLYSGIHTHTQKLFFLPLHTAGQLVFLPGLQLDLTVYSSHKKAHQYLFQVLADLLAFEIIWFNGWGNRRCHFCHAMLFSAYFCPLIPITRILPSNQRNFNLSAFRFRNQ